MADVNYNEKKHVEQVVSEPAKLKEKGIGGMFADIFLSENIGKVKEYLVSDVVVPAIKETIVSIVQNGIEMLFYGSSGTYNRNTRKNDGGTYVSYNGYYNKGLKSDRTDTSNRNRSRHSTRDVIFATRGDAERTKAELVEAFRKYKSATFADFCYAAKVDYTYMEEKWGWYELDDQDLRVIPVRGGFVIDMPKPIYLE